MYSFRAILALLHPLVPFVTERLWQALPHEGPALITAPWPQHAGAIDAAALSSFQVMPCAVTWYRADAFAGCMQHLWLRAEGSISGL